MTATTIRTADAKVGIKLTEGADVEDRIVADGVSVQHDQVRGTLLLACDCVQKYYRWDAPMKDFNDEISLDPSKESRWVELD